MREDGRKGTNVRNGEPKQHVWWGEWAMIALLVVAVLVWIGRQIDFHPVDKATETFVEKIFPPTHILPSQPFPNR